MLSHPFVTASTAVIDTGSCVVTQFRPAKPERRAASSVLIECVAV